MATFLKAIPRILVMITPTSQKVLREKTCGIMRYAHLHGPWEIQFLDDSPFVAQLGALKNWRPDGIITRGDPSSVAALTAGTRKIHTVFLDAPPPVTPSNHMSVHHDVRYASEAVADIYLQQGLTHFAYVGSVSVPQPFWSSERGAAYAARLLQTGHVCEFYQPKNSKDWGIEQHHLREWLVALPKPCGLFAAFDLLAKQVLDTCLAAGIRVPEDIAVIGADNDETICENTIPTLSSVQSDFEGGAYRAAELLDKLIRGKIRKPVRLTYSHRRVVHRQSSQFTPGTSWCVARAMEFIRLNACEGITIPDVAGHLHVSRSHIEKQFKKAMGRSVLEEIQTRRLERLCALLRETALPIGEIGERCGYPTETYLKRLFKKRFRMTMREYRKQI